MQALAQVRALRLRTWCVGAGAVRNLVWDALHESATPSALADIDVRRNPARVSIETYRRRIASKRYAQRWPRVTIIEA